MAMEKARTIKLCFHRQDEKRDWKTLENCTLGQARDVVQSALRSADGLYMEADICVGSVYTETISRAAAEMAQVSMAGVPGCESGEELFKVQIRMLA
jgi:hypothetical protein